MSNIAIQVNKLSKQYRIGELHQGAYRYFSLRESLTQALSSPLKFFSRKPVKPPERGTIWALKEIDFEIKQGEVVGIIGRNGAGKTTLLRILSRITPPTSGRAYLFGRVGSLLEVGTGFHPELTGRENIYMSGSILGMRKKEIDKKFDEIVAFAEIEKFIDTPVKRYSSGMYVRLAFAVAAHLEPEILLVDEVLAVGDVGFQKKCLKKMHNVAREGRTVLFVSHGMDAVRSLCERVIWLEEGKIRHEGECAEVITAYLDFVSEAMTRGEVAYQKSDPRFPVQLEKVVLKNERGEITNRFQSGSDIQVEITFYSEKTIEEPYFWIGIGEEHSIFAANSLVDGKRPRQISGRGKIACTFHKVPLLPRFYNIFMGARDASSTSVILPSLCVAHFEVLGSPQDFGFQGEIADALIKKTAPVVVDYSWDFSQAELEPVSLRES